MSSKRPAVLLSVLLAAALLLPASFVPAAVRGAPVRSQGAGVRNQSAFPAEAVPPFPADSLTPEADAEDLTQGDWWAAVQEDIGRSEYDVTWQEQTGLPDPPAPSSGGATDENVPQAAGLRVGGREPQSSGLRYSPVSGAYQAPNRAHNLRTYFTADGIPIVPRTEVTPTWSLSLALTGYGEAQPTVSGNRVEYARGAITEWYVNDEAGLHHGMQIAAGQAGSPLVIQTSPSPGTSSLWLRRRAGRSSFSTAAASPLLRYGPLAVRRSGWQRAGFTLHLRPVSLAGRGTSRSRSHPAAAFPVRLEATYHSRRPGCAR